MIQKINKSFKDLKFGLLGFRSSLVEEILIKNNINYKNIIEDEIDNSFDIIFGSGVYNIISDKIINKPKYGIFIIHESPLPEGRGHAPLQWTVKNKRPNLTLSLFKASSGVDNGYIVYQHNIEINKIDTITDIEYKRQQGIKECFEIFLSEIKENIIVLRKQTGKSSYHKKRTPIHSKITTIPDVEKFWDEIRICDNEKYPAFFEIDNKKIILKYYIDDNK
jgi:methionyl-tRNA formyltransferase